MPGAYDEHGEGQRPGDYLNRRREAHEEVSRAFRRLGESLVEVLMLREITSWLERRLDRSPKR